MSVTTSEHVTRPPEGDVATPEDELAFASQWRLMWLRFRRHRLALIGAAVLLVMYVAAAFCEFLAPR